MILERVASPRAEAVQSIVDAIADDERWEVVNRSGQFVWLWPTAWGKLLPDIGRGKKYNAAKWMFLNIQVGKTRCSSVFTVAGPTDDTLRRRIIERLVEDPKEFGLKAFFRELDKIGASWTTFARQRLLEWSENEGPDIERLTQVVLENLDKRHGKLAGVPDAIRPVIKQWERERRSPTT